MQMTETRRRTVADVIRVRRALLEHRHRLDAQLVVHLLEFVEEAAALRSPLFEKTLHAFSFRAEDILVGARPARQHM